MSESNGRSGFGFGDVMMAFLTGAVAGATYAYLTAPKRGQDLRDELRTRAEDARDTAHRVPQALREATDAAVDAFEAALRKEHGAHGHTGS